MSSTDKELESMETSAAERLVMPAGDPPPYGSVVQQSPEICAPPVQPVKTSWKQTRVDFFEVLSSNCLLMFLLILSLCCGCIFGIVAAILIVCATRSDDTGPRSRYITAAIVVAIIGVVAGLVTIVVVFEVERAQIIAATSNQTFTTYADCKWPRYWCQPRPDSWYHWGDSHPNTTGCYNYRDGNINDHIYTAYTCAWQYPGPTCVAMGYCYHNDYWG